MLRFREFRFREEGETPTLPATVPPSALAVKMQTTVDAVGKVIDAWATQLKQKILNPMTPPEQRRGLWDRFKNWTSNIWHGRYNQTNPYFWTNKLGDDLGRQESYTPTVSEYRKVRSIVENLEYRINELSSPDMPSLKVVSIIDQAAQELKKVLQQLISKEVQLDDKPSPPIPATEEPAAEIPAEPEVKEPEKPAVVPPATEPEPAAEVKPPATEPKVEPEPPAVTPPGKSEPSLNQQKPNTGGRRWQQLTAEEQMAWNNYGGGAAHKPSGWLKDQGVKSLPWILRSGDPRHDLLDKQPRQVWGPLMVSQGRIEYSTDPINSPEELRIRVEKAKENYEKWREGMSQTHKKASSLQAGERGVSDAETAATAQGTTPIAAPPNEKKATPTTGSAGKQATAKMTTLPPNEKTGGGTGLSDPAHSTASVDPNNPGKSAKKPSREETTQRKQALWSRVEAMKDNLGNKTLRELKSELKSLRPGDEAGFAEFENKVAHEEEIQKLMGELPADESVARKKGMMIRENISRPSISFSERLKYLKEISRKS